MFKLICKFLLVTANVGAFTSCSIHKWGEEEMPEMLSRCNLE